ncbi:MAG: hypothetical protein KC493_07875 [Bacteriovoracaceae bacterium]|nr:hypothetical protein [Bacteriovoracaceae bacterium]
MKTRTLSLFAVLLAFTSCSSNKEVLTNRELSSIKERSSEEADKAYWKRRGKDWVKFEYDGYTGKKNKLKFLKTIASVKNIKMSSELSGRRQQLFEENLFDTGVSANKSINCDKVMKRVHRTPYGECYFHKYDHLSDRDVQFTNQLRMGAKGERFGRNIDADKIAQASKQDLMKPNPLEISKKLLARKNGKQVDAPVINVLATAWLQAMNHDWFTHGKNSKKKHHTIDAHKSHGDFKHGMKVPATREETKSERALDNHGYDKTFRNQVTHWWDASQIYGSDPKTIRKVRTLYKNGKSTGKLLADGKIAVDTKNRRLHYDSRGLPVTGFHDNWWVGLELIHTIFHLEHNSIVDNILKPQIGKKICVPEGSGRKFPKSECDEILFEKARMINAALIAKIHTAEWTPALLDNEMLHVGMRSNWYGMREVAGLSLPALRARVDGGIKHLISGLVGKKTLDLYSVPFTLTEEFVAVYRMHPLVPDFVNLRDGKTNKPSGKVSTHEMIFRKAQGTFGKHGSATWMNSFGTSFPGAMTLHNYPTWMSNFKAERNTGTAHEDSVQMDMGAIDVFRDRERGVPKYNAFRRALHMPAINSFEELTPNKEDQETLKEIYSNDIEKVDLIVGTLAEKDRYPGYAFGNTPFYIFALMASRRLMADPFFSDYFTKDYYTKKGINHVQKQTMSDVIIRHYPEFKNRFYGKRRIFPGDKKIVKNAFRPWLPVYSDVKKAIKDMDGL